MLSVRLVAVVLVPDGRGAFGWAAGCGGALGCETAGCELATGELAAGVAAACCGRLEAVPGGAGVTAGRVVPFESSVFCEVSMTDLLGSKVSSLCSPLVMSTSADTPVRNLSAPRSGSSVLLILAARSRSMACRYSRLASLVCAPSAKFARRGRLSRLPFMSTIDTD